MKHRVLLSCLIIAAVLASGCASAPVINDSTPVISISRMGENDYKGLEAMVREGGSVVIELPAGTRLPVAVNVDMPMGAINNQELGLEIKTDLFLFVTGKGIWMSPDKKSWCLANDLAGMKKVFGISQGNLSLGLEETKEKGPRVNIDMVAKQAAK